MRSAGGVQAAWTLPRGCRAEGRYFSPTVRTTTFPVRFATGSIAAFLELQATSKGSAIKNAKQSMVAKAIRLIQLPAS